MDRSFDTLDSRLLIQCTLGEAAGAAEIAREHGAGLVLTGTSSEAVVKQLRRAGFPGPILCDADRYSGAARVGGARGIDPSWCQWQRGQGLVPLTDSGFLEAQDWAGLRAILRGASAQPDPIIAMLPLAARWVATAESCEGLVRAINATGTPVAIAVEHHDDPFSVQSFVRNFLELIRAVTVPVLLLRSDVSAIGALCHGAYAAALGTRSSLRHIYPAGPRGAPNHPEVAAFVRPLLSYHKLTTCARFVAETPDLQQLWPCDCHVCGGALPGRLAYADAPKAAAETHSLHTQLDIYDELLDNPRARRRSRKSLISSWYQTCDHALAIHEELAETMRGWTPPKNLRAWNKVTDDPLAAARSYVGEQPDTQTVRPSQTEPSRRDR